MVAKIAFGLLVIAILISVVIASAYRYFDRQAERAHEKEMEQLEHTERLVEQAEREYKRDRER